MVQMARNLTDAEEPFLTHTRLLIMDQDTKYSAAFRAASASTSCAYVDHGESTAAGSSWWGGCYAN
jgi:hypothetical protein